MKYTTKEYKILTQYVKKGGIERKIVYRPLPLYEQTAKTEDNIFFSDNIAETFVRIQLKKLARIGNLGAIRIVNNYFHDDVMEDLKQEVLVKLWENMDKLFTPNVLLTPSEQNVKDFNTFGFSFIDYRMEKITISEEMDGKKIEYEKSITISKTKQRIYGAVSNYLYKIANKYNKNEVLFVEMYNERTDKIETQSYTDWKNMEDEFHKSTEEELIQSLNTLLTERQLTVLQYYHGGYSFTEISKFLSCSVVNVTKIFHKAMDKLQNNEQKVRKSLRNI